MIKGILKGMLVTIKAALFGKRVTIQYPFEKRERPYRGLHELEEDKCVVCHLCARSCPNDAINITQKPGHEKTRKLEDYDYTIDIGKCIWCGFCEDVCPKDAIRLTNRYEMAEYDRNKLIIDKF